MFENRIAVLSEEGIKLYDKWLSSLESEFIGMMSLIFVFLSVLVMIHRRTEDKFYQNCILFLFLPVLITIMNQYLYTFINMNFIWDFTSGSNLTILESLALRKLTMIQGTLMMLYFSTRSSVYLLKNNRTLK
jgi:hypothetical protein